MSRPPSHPPPVRSWKDIRQGVNRDAMSHEGLKRMVIAGVKLVAGCVGTAAALWFALDLYQTWDSNPMRIKAPVKTEPLREVVLVTDGVVDRAWLDFTLALPRQASLMELDLQALQRRLLASGQIQSAVLTRRFPDQTLIVALQERTPVARLWAQEGAGKPVLRLVARDGVVYEGVGYHRDLLERLLWLDGVALRRVARGGFEPLAGMETVADLLNTAQNLAPHLCRGWEVISLAGLAADHELIVRAQENTRRQEIVFDCGEGFAQQLARLDYIVDYLREHAAPAFVRVNLALGSQVAVELESTGTAPRGRLVVPVPSAVSLPRKQPTF